MKWIKNTGAAHWGGNQRVVVADEIPCKEIRGTVYEETGQPANGALVEIFTHPEYLLQVRSIGIKNEDEPQQRRIATCRTGPDGKFCFRNLAAGKYELRSSIDSGWDVTSIYVVVDPSKGKQKVMRVDMHLGT